MSRPKRTAAKPPPLASDPFWGAPGENDELTPAELKESWEGYLPQTTNLGSLLKQQLPPHTPVIAPWLHLGESCLLWGGTGTGKSMIALTLALGAAGGGSVFGWSFPNPMKVLFVDGEQSVRDLQRRLKFLATGIAGLDLEKAGENLIVMARSTQGRRTKFVDIGEQDQADILAAQIEAAGVGLVVFDNLSTLSDSIADENQAAAFKPMQALLTRLKKHNTAVILLHHSGKDLERGFRGSSSIATTFERVLGISRNPSASVAQVDVTVKLEKFRDAVPTGFQPTFPLVLSTDENGDAYWKVGQLGQLEEAWRLFSKGNFKTNAEFVAECNKRFDTNRRPGNIGRDFCRLWMADLGVTEDEIERAKKRMKALRKYDEDETEDSPERPEPAF